ncbi:ABC transporter ATP-binding protein [Acanthopleuribacter pedis]|uniref:ABC transporter ATP-binding protein n=1 Tax=Acanthopleuribacter pedis TaxID=442870 RepID=A0A8J7QRH3_9BACT|nr:ABC transporter ATP-binding protein [Acanthopleuribacter pedis]MBO1323345.1 ABC transporter ATP-binding protein [Acanthopleuribacter pedis]
MSALTLRGVGVERRRQSILHGIDLDVAAQQFTLILGPNGCGKTTLLKCILAMINDYTGHITWKGRNTRTMGGRERARALAYVPQKLETAFALDVLTFMELARFAHEESREQRRNAIDAALAQTDMQHKAGAFLSELSGGEQQRVLIAAAVAQEPELLVLDEPTSALDPRHQVAIVQLLARLHQQKRFTIVLVTHDWNPFIHLNPRVIGLKAGRLLVDTDLKQLPNHLASIYDCRFHQLPLEKGVVCVPVIESNALRLDKKAVTSRQDINTT